MIKDGQAGCRQLVEQLVGVVQRGVQQSTKIQSGREGSLVAREDNRCLVRQLHKGLTNRNEQLDVEGIDLAVVHPQNDNIVNAVCCYERRHGSPRRSSARANCLPARYSQCAGRNASDAAAR